MNDDQPYTSPTPAPNPINPNADGMLTAIAVVNYIFGTMQLLCGACLALVGGGIGTIFGAASNSDPDFPEEAKWLVAGGTALVVFLGIIVAVTGFPTILAGYGVQKRAQWGRILTIVMGILAGVMALFNLVQLNPSGLIPAAYSVFVLVILFDNKYASLFK